ncbi:MAG: integration host factor subunit beta [Thiotrichales bacterium]|jgi:integration host factor subunit beta|nr:integration host factor subunit beta [Thiotrichales bacterium]
MTKSELIDLIARRQHQLPAKDIELAVNLIIETLSDALATDDRIEIRGFGSFTLHHRKPRIGRNPKTGAAVALESKSVPHFKPGKELKEAIDASKAKVKLVG